METVYKRQDVKKLLRVSIESKRNGNRVEKPKAFVIALVSIESKRNGNLGERQNLSSQVMRFQSNLRGMETRSAIERIFCVSFRFNRI